jgi:putative Holliday junction resolvase
MNIAFDASSPEQPDAEPLPARPVVRGRVLGIDYGTKRLGLAVSDEASFFASPYGARERRSLKSDLADVLTTARGLGAAAIVVGRPRALDTSRAGDSESGAAALAASLREAVAQAGESWPVYEWDERFSTSQALRQGRESGISQKRGRSSTGADSIDARAAAIILQSFLDAHRAPLSAPDSDAGSFDPENGEF